jgi:hypothetical protein
MFAVDPHDCNLASLLLQPLQRPTKVTANSLLLALAMKDITKLLYVSMPAAKQYAGS